MPLKLPGHRVQSAAYGLGAIEAARANPPDIMLVDVGLPGIDGYEVARRVRREPGLKEVVLVAPTRCNHDEHIRMRWHRDSTITS
jgi:CheY-like chemotaxis protein